ncbi:MAG: hypothetical protein ABIF40_02820 [archaeon]
MVVETPVSVENDDKLKQAFKKVKDDFLTLQKEIESNKEAIICQNKLISDLQEKLGSISQKDSNSLIDPNLDTLGPKLVKSAHLSPQSSIGNRGVMQLFNNYSTIIHSTDIQQLSTSFGKLPKQELLTFLTIYQLEDDLGRIGYPHVASHLGLSEGCVRTYVASLIKKGYPVKKERFNNKVIFLRVPSDFRDLDIKTRLFELFSSLYQSFPFPQKD